MRNGARMGIYNRKSMQLTRERLSLVLYTVTQTDLQVSSWTEIVKKQL